MYKTVEGHSSSIDHSQERISYRTTEPLLTSMLCTLLCLCAPETRQHFTSECIFLELERSRHREKLVASKAFIKEDASRLHDSEFLTQLSLDVSVVINIGRTDKEALGSLELLIREYIFKIHSK